MTSENLVHEAGHPKLVFWDNPEGQDLTYQAPPSMGFPRQDYVEGCVSFSQEFS